MIIDDKVMTLREVSEYLKVHPSTIYRQLKRGLIPAFKVGSDWRFNIESIDRWRLGQDSPSVVNGGAWSASGR
jgi:excisionase family DNA binding protein